MAQSDPLPFVSAFPADDEVDDARWLANLIMTVRAQAERAGHSEVAMALDDALAAAQAIADATKRH